MRNRGLVAIAAIATVLAVGGLGFAAFTSTVTLSVSGTAGTFALGWTDGNGVGLSTVNCTSPMTDSNGYAYCTTWSVGNSYIDCSASISGTTLTISGSNLAPGNGCELNAGDEVQISNTGSLPGTVAANFTPNNNAAEPPGCNVNYPSPGPGYDPSGWSLWWFGDNVFYPLNAPNPSSVPISAHGTVPGSGGYVFYIWMDPGAVGTGPTGCEGASFTTIVYLTGTAV